MVLRINITQHKQVPEIIISSVLHMMYKGASEITRSSLKEMYYQNIIKNSKHPKVSVNYKLYRLHPVGYVVFNYFLQLSTQQTIWGYHQIKDKWWYMSHSFNVNIILELIMIHI
jgi:hypothetical protein